MILKRVHVKNFRAIRDAVVEFGGHTAILGANGTGKSTILRAIDRFYASNTNVDLDDFFGRRTDASIEISITFEGFSTDEIERFGDRIQDGEMTVARVFEAGGVRGNGRYFGYTRQHPAFSEIRKVTGANDKKRAYKELRENSPAYELGDVSKADDIDPLLVQWEQDHPEACELMRDDGQFFGFSNVGRGNLQKSTSFVFIPAVRDASADAVDARGAVVARLMELVVRSAVQRRADIREFQARASAEYKELVNPERLVELGSLSGSLTRTLKEFYSEAGVALRWRPPEDFAVPLPNADVLLEENGFEGPVDRKGHGLQRAFILTLLQHLALATAADADQPQPADDGAAELLDAEVLQYVLPGLILAIEEPELYQHPTKQRHFAKVLRRLADGSLPGVATRTQVVFASHSSLFVSLDRFDEVRLARRHAAEPKTDRECRLTRSTLEMVARSLERAHSRAVGEFSAESVRGRLHIMDSELSEGFFADLVVLVEGTSDRAALIAAASLAGVDLEASGIAILAAGGKNNLDRPAAIFRELEIPTYLIWDCDHRGETIEGLNANHALQRLSGIDSPYDAQTFVGPSFSSFQDKLETLIRDEFAGTLSNYVEAIRVQFDIVRSTDVLKAPFAMTGVLRLAAADGVTSNTLSQIVAAIMNQRATI